MFEIEKKESKNLKKKLVQLMRQSPQYNQSRRSLSSASKEVFIRKLTNLERPVPYLDNPSDCLKKLDGKVINSRSNIKQ